MIRSSIIGSAIAFSSLAVSISSFAFGSFVNTPLLASKSQIINGTQQYNAAWLNLLADCDAALVTAASPVQDFSPGPHYDSNGTATPDPIAVQLNTDSANAYKLGICYQNTGRSEYALHAQNIIDAWAATMTKIGDGQGHYTVSFAYPSFILAADMVRSQGAWKDGGFRNHLKSLIMPRMKFLQGSTSNNISNWGNLTYIAAAAYITSSPRVTAAVASSAGTDLANGLSKWKDNVNSQIDPKTFQFPQEVCRSDTNAICSGNRKYLKGIEYTNYSIEPLTVSAQIFSQFGLLQWDSAEVQKLINSAILAAKWTNDITTFPYFPTLQVKGLKPAVGNTEHFWILSQHSDNPDILDAAKKMPRGKYQLWALFP